MFVISNGKLYDNGKEVRVQVGENIFRLNLCPKRMSLDNVEKMTQRYSIKFLSSKSEELL
jgi:hypothetical protein